MYQPKSLHEIRIYHSRIIMSVLRQNGPMTKNDLALKTGLSLSSVTNILKILTERNLVTLGDKIDSFAGRPATYIVPVLDAVYSVGIDVTQYHVRFVLMNLGEPVLAFDKHDVLFQNTDEYWDRILEWLEAFIDANHIDRGKIGGVKMATRFAVPYCERKGVVPILLDREPVMIDVDEISKKYSRYNFEFILNTKVAGAIYGLWEAKELSDYVSLSVGSTVGGCLVRNYEPLNVFDMSDTFGHMIVRPDGRPCSCGRRGCLEAQCASSGLFRPMGFASEDAFFQALDEGDERCRESWNTYLDDLTTALNNLFMAYDLDIVISGSMAPYLEKRRDELDSRLFREYALFPVRKKLIFSHDGEYAAAIGSAAVVINAFLSEKVK